MRRTPAIVLSRRVESSEVAVWGGFGDVAVGRMRLCGSGKGSIKWKLDLCLVRTAQHSTAQQLINAAYLRILVTRLPYLRGHQHSHPLRDRAARVLEIAQLAFPGPLPHPQLFRRRPQRAICRERSLINEPQTNGQKMNHPSANPPSSGGPPSTSASARSALRNSVVAAFNGWCLPPRFV